MRTDVPWIEGVAPGRLAFTPRPCAIPSLDAEMRRLREAGVDVVASFLEPLEAARLGLDDEAGACARQGLLFHAFPISDHGVPDSLDETRAFAQELQKHVAQGRSVLVHCYAGIGRSALVSACVLLLLGVPLDAVLDRLERARGLRVPETAAQLDFLARFAKGPAA
ncbi:MAG: tyrosine-protein phosphatase [Planctomycetota bacterium]|nr:tyrosine-protein phosphatase [Planctomycetota bacterium]